MSSDPEYTALAGQLAQTATVGRYILHRQIARGGMATIHIARLMGDEGFSRIVAAKRLHPEFAEDSEFVAMFLDEARIASKVHHRNVVPVLDVVTTQDEVLLVQELVHGAPLHWLLNKTRQLQERIPIDIAVSIATQVLAGLHAAHELVDEMGMALNVVHRDVSPQNVMVATDGTARLLDFGVAKASMAAHTTREGTYKGKLAYSAPEQLRGQATKQSDLYALAVVLWELIVGHRMHGAQSEVELVATIMNGRLPTLAETLTPEREWQAIGDDSWSQVVAVDAIISRGLAVDAADRWTTAVEMEEALCRAVPPAATSAVAAWLRRVGKEYLDKHDRLIAEEEASWRRTGGGASTTSRRSSPAGTRLRTSVGVDRPMSAAPLAPRPQRSRTMVALLGALVAGVAIGVVMLLKSPSAASRAPEPQPLLEPAPPPAAATVREEVPPPLRSSSSTEPTEQARTVEPTRPEPRTPPTRTPPTRAAPSRPAVRQAPRAVARTVEARPDVIAPPGTPAVPEAKIDAKIEAKTDGKPDKPDCTPPYYFDGAKKIFKPACL
ncbi:MAG: protein kinase [Myxococcales bacterium]|nr:protein kinase [Myxococcales bacterium]